ncbi:hypothetical protein Pelo_13918 [Pelomyxa schiedti]|nr:hypothetical protein Pelo_13918 [Pelomyxa schiedti]
MQKKAKTDAAQPPPATERVFVVADGSTAVRRLHGFPQLRSFEQHLCPRRMLLISTSARCMLRHHGCTEELQPVQGTLPWNSPMQLLIHAMRTLVCVLIIVSALDYHWDSGQFPLPGRFAKSPHYTSIYGSFPPVPDVVSVIPAGYQTGHQAEFLTLTLTILTSHLYVQA